MSALYALCIPLSCDNLTIIAHVFFVGIIAVSIDCFNMEWHKKRSQLLQILAFSCPKTIGQISLAPFLPSLYSGHHLDAFLTKGFYTISALKTNRLIFPAGIKRQISQFAPFIHKTDPNVSLVTVGKRQYYVYRYEGNLKDQEDVVVLISFPKEAFGIPSALRAFICTDASLTTREILDSYLVRWSIEVFFRQAKQNLALDQYQIRSALGIRRFWLLMSTAHLFSCIGTGQTLPFHEGFALMQKAITSERISFIYHCALSRVPLAHVLAFAA